jgi:hypothetical protein
LHLRIGTYARLATHGNQPIREVDRHWQTKRDEISVKRDGVVRVVDNVDENSNVANDNASDNDVDDDDELKSNEIVGDDGKRRLLTTSAPPSFD